MQKVYCSRPGLS